MKKLLGIDYGEKRIGLAIADDGWARPFSILDNTSRKDVLASIGEIIKEEKIDTVVYGLPKTFSGRESERFTINKKFGEILTKELSVPVEFISEIFTSKLARLSAETKLQKKNVDDRAACFILENYIKKQQCKD